MITLYTLPPAFGFRNVSPFCLKTEMLLSHLSLDYDTVLEKDPRKTPKGKLPWLDLDGQVVADSELIFMALDKHTQGGVYGGIDPVDRARGVAFVRLAEEHLYWILVASRWLDDAWFPNIVSDFFGFVPGPFRGIASGLARRSVRQTYHLQGLGRHSREEETAFARADLGAIADTVSVTPFLLGEQLTPFDFGVASIVISIIDQRPPTWINPIADEFPPLRDYAERVQTAVGVFGRYV